MILIVNDSGYASSICVIPFLKVLSLSYLEDKPYLSVTQMC